MAGSPYGLLAEMDDIHLVWTDDPRVLEGRRARWFPSRRAIAIDSRLRRVKARCSLAHELGHVVLGHGASCGIEFFDYRAELAADEFAARLLLDDLDELATELAINCTYGQAAEVLRVTRDLLNVRLATFTDAERCHVDRAVWAMQEGAGA